MDHSTTEVPTDKSKIGDGEGLNRIIRIVEAKIQDHLGPLIRQSMSRSV